MHPRILLLARACGRPVPGPFPRLKLCSVWATIGVFWGQNAARVHDCAPLAELCVRDRGAHGPGPFPEFWADLVAPLTDHPISPAPGGGGGLPGKSQIPWDPKDVRGRLPFPSLHFSASCAGRTFRCILRGPPRDPSADQGRGARADGLWIDCAEGWGRVRTTGARQSAMTQCAIHFNHRPK